MRSFVVDGNFTADHVRQKRPMDDVWLLDGEGMMTERAQYARHLAIAVETPSVSGLHIFSMLRALMLDIEGTLRQ